MEEIVDNVIYLKAEIVTLAVRAIIIRLVVVIIGIRIFLAYIFYSLGKGI